MSAVLFALMALAAYRAWRLLALDTILDRPREALLERMGDKTADFISCPWCAGAWLSAGVLAVTAQFTSVPLPFLQWAAVSALVGLIGSNLDG